MAFGKTSLLKAKETETLNFTITAKDLAAFDEENSNWLVEDGEYTLKVGASSKDIKLKESFKVEKRYHSRKG